MPAQTEIIDMISDTAGIGKIGLLSPADDCVISFAGGKLIKKYLDGSERHTMNLQLQGKGKDQLKLADKLCGICDALTHKRPRTFPKTDEWEICGVSVGTPPAPKGQAEDGTWFYACILSVNYCYKPRKD